MPRAYLWFAAAILLSLSACGGGGEQVPPIAPKINPETKVADATTRQALSNFVINNAPACLAFENPARPPCTTTLTFSSSAPQVAALKVGNILVSEPTAKAPNGFLQKITSINTAGNVTTIQATEVSIGEAIEEGEASFQKTLSASDLQSATALAQSVRFANGQSGFSAQSGVRPMATLDFSFDEVVYDVDGNNSTTNDQIRVKGNVNFDLQNGFSAGVTWKKKWGIPLYPNGIYFKVAYGVKENASVSVTANFSKQMDKEIELASYKFSPITVMVGPVPLVFIPTLKITVKATGEVKAQFSFGASNVFNAQACLEYRDGFRDCSEFNQSFDAGVGVAAATGKARASLNGKVDILLYGLVGPYAKVGAYIELDAAVPRKPTWKLDAGVNASIGIHADLYVKTLNADLPILDKSLGTIATSKPTPPTVTIGGGFNLGNPQLGQPYNICASATDLEDGSRPVTLSSNIDGNLGTIAAGASPSCISRVFSTEGARTITASASNTSNLSASTSANINVQDPPPDLFISQPTAANKTAESSLVLQGGWLDPSLSSQDCTKVTWTSNVGTDAMPTNGCGSTLMKLSSSTTPRTITMRAVNARGKQGTKSVTFNVDPKPAVYNAPPIAAITGPTNFVGSGGASEVPELGSTNIALNGWIQDDDDGNLTLNYTWQVAQLISGSPGPKTFLISTAVNGGAILPKTLTTFTIASITALFPGNACGRSFRVFLEVTDGRAGPPARPIIVTQDFKLPVCIN